MLNETKDTERICNLNKNKRSNVSLMKVRKGRQRFAVITTADNVPHLGRLLKLLAQLALCAVLIDNNTVLCILVMFVDSVA